MKIKGLTLGQIEKCARESGDFMLRNVRSEGNYTLFVLRMASHTPSAAERKWFDRAHTLTLNAKQDRKYRDLATRMLYRKRGISRVMGGRGPEYGAAVCFHGFKVFMARVFRVNPSAIIRTTRATYRGREDFEAKYPEVETQMCRGMYGERCDC